MQRFGSVGPAVFAHALPMSALTLVQDPAVLTGGPSWAFTAISDRWARAPTRSGPRGRDELTWELDQVEQVLQRRRQQEREPVKAPFISHTQRVAVGLLAAAGAGMLILSVL